jgi:hypothetical protein
MSKRFYQQSNRFSGTKAQIDYLRCVHQGLPSNTNVATMYRCHGFLLFEGDKVRVKPEIIEQLGLDAQEPTKQEATHRYTQRCQMIKEHGRLTSEQE